MNCGLGCNLALFLKLYPRTQEAPKYGRAWSHWQKALSRSMIKDKEKRRDVGTVMVCSYGGDSHKQSSCLRTHMSGCTQCWEDRYPLLWCLLKSAELLGLWWKNWYFWVRWCSGMTLVVWNDSAPLQKNEWNGWKVLRHLGERFGRKRSQMHFLIYFFHLNLYSEFS